MPIHRYPGGVINADNVTPGANQASGVWTLESQLQANGTGFWPQSTSQMSRSLRFNSADSAYLTRTPAVAGNRRTWTWSAWVKRCSAGANHGLLAGIPSEPYVNQITSLTLGSSNELVVQDYIVGSHNLVWNTSAVFRDPSAWYHIVCAYDTTQASSANAVKLYVNNVQQTITFTAYTGSYVQNRESFINNTNPNILGRYVDTGYLNGYMTEVILVDGQALDPTSFGYTDSNNVWQPKPYAGSVGTNGFYLTFADNTSNTSTGIGKDYSNRGNNWTPVNFSVASGAGNDSLVDVPTNWGTDTGLGGEVRGNYCTLNPLNSNSTVTLSNGNLQAIATSGNWFPSLGTIAMSSGKWYWEQTLISGTSSFVGIGAVGASIAAGNYPGAASNTYGYQGSNGQKYNNSSGSGYGATFTANDVIGVALDMDAKTLTFYKNGVSQGIAFSSLPAPEYLPMMGVSPDPIAINFGQRPFAYTAPSGFKALCTQNLPTPTVQNGGQYFNTVLWTGNGSTQTISGVGFQPDFVWGKVRDSADISHRLIDVIRGVNSQLYSNAASSAGASTQDITAFTSDGFSVGTATALNWLSHPFVAWNWKANGAGSSNTAGSITSTVSANQTAGFSVVKYTGAALAGATVGHGLGAAPRMVFCKVYSATSNWIVYHASVGATKVLVLNLSQGESTSAAFNNTAPSSSVITLGGSGEGTNDGSVVAYCFAPVSGYSAFGSYTGNGSSDGPFIYTGFRPAYVLVKNSSSARDWAVWDVKRNTFNLVNTYLTPNSSAAEASDNTVSMDILSNGFKVRGTWVGMNNSGETIIYAAFAENPFKIARAR